MLSKILPVKPFLTKSFRIGIPALLEPRSPNSLLKNSAICAATSMPTSSSKVAFPTGKPKPFDALSMSFGLTPSYTKNARVLVKYSINR